MPKVNVYLPDDLADEARAAKLSLSPICQKAIRKELKKVQAKQAATKELEAVAARLNDTIDDEENDEQWDDGRDDGVAWAQMYATAAELRSIVTDFEPGRGGDFENHSICRFMGDKTGDNVFSVGHNDDEAGPYWSAFIAGAREVLEAVEPLLDD